MQHFHLQHSYLAQPSHRMTTKQRVLYLAPNPYSCGSLSHPATGMSSVLLGPKPRMGPKSVPEPERPNMSKRNIQEECRASFVRPQQAPSFLAFVRLSGAQGVPGHPTQGSLGLIAAQKLSVSLRHLHWICALLPAYIKT